VTARPSATAWAERPRLGGSEMASYTVGVMGNPNSGKTTLFNALTGARQRVGNWPGVTVERKTGEYTFQGDHFEVVDLPGTYTFSAHSLDEQVARDYVLSGDTDLLVNIVDGTNLERNLYLTVQAIELRVPVIVALNMMDVVRADRTTIDIPQLSAQLGCPVVPMAARTGEGVEELRQAIAAQAPEKPVSSARIEYPQVVEEGISRLAEAVEQAARERNTDARWLAVKLIENDEWALAVAGSAVAEPLARAKRLIEADLGDESDIAVADGRYGFINGITRSVVSRTGEARRSLTRAIDRVVLNRLLGVPIFILMMYLTFTITISFGGCFIDFFDQLFGTVFVDGFRHVLANAGAPPWLTVFLADGIGGGIQLIATLIPPIGLMFLCLAILEDSGYMARAAFVMDRLMRLIGLPGKAFVPMLIGIGCNVPAIMATRTLDRERDRLMTIAMNPFMSCGARLPVYALFGIAFFPGSRGLLIFSLYLIGILLAIVTGLVLKNSLLRAELPSFVMELPPYHAPTVRGTALHTWYRLKGFVFRAGKVILVVIIVMSFLNSIGTDGSFGHENSGRSVLSAIGRAIVPVFRPMGIRDDNWPAAVGLFSGIFAKEAVVGALDSLYGQMDAGDRGSGADEAGPFDLRGGIRAAFATIPANLHDTFGGGPLSALFGPPDAESSAEGQPDGVSQGTYVAMKRRFDGATGAYAYLLFVLIYAPCVAAMAAIYRETNLKWTVFIVGYLTVLAWMVAVGFYQAATFARHPGPSAAWLAGVVGAYVLFVVVLRRIGRGRRRREA